MTVSAILKHKGTNVASVSPGNSLADVANVLAFRRIGAVVVLEGDALVGIITERDIIYALAGHGAEAMGMKVAALMITEVHTATMATTYDDAIRAMTDGRFRHMPVLEGKRLAGIVSIGDVVKARMMEQEAEVDGLRAYVAGSA